MIVCVWVYVWFHVGVFARVHYCECVFALHVHGYVRECLCRCARACAYVTMVVQV